MLLNLLDRSINGAAYDRGVKSANSFFDASAHELIRFFNEHFLHNTGFVQQASWSSEYSK